MKKVRPCHFCQQDTPQEISSQIGCDRSFSYGWFCQNCKQWVYSNLPAKDGTKKLWIAKRLLLQWGVNLESVPVGGRSEPRHCSKCGKMGAQQHHWAPREIFGADAENWRKDDLCPKCHTEWHAKMTPWHTHFKFVRRAQIEFPGSNPPIPLVKKRASGQLDIFPDATVIG